MPRAKTFRSLLLTSISVATLAGCGSSGGPDVNKTAAPMPPVTEMDAAMNAPAPQPLAPTDTLTPVMPNADTTTVTTMTAVPAASSSVEERMAKLEQSVNSLRSDYDRIMPAFASLNTTNERIQTLLDEIEKETGKLPAAASVSAVDTSTPVKTSTMTTQNTVITPPALVMKAEPAVEPVAAIAAQPETPAVAAPLAAEAKTETSKTAEAAVAPVAAEKPAAKSANSVTGVRIGEHGSKTRLVIDLTSKTKPEFKYDLDNGEKLLLVELPSSGWTAKESGKPNSPLIESWNVQKGANGGSTLAVQLKKDARILSTEFLKAEGKDPARLVMDIASGS